MDVNTIASWPSVYKPDAELGPSDCDFGPAELRFERAATEGRRPVNRVKVMMQVAWHSWRDYAKGQKAEDLFVHTATDAGFKVWGLPHSQYNYKGHVDFEIEGTQGPEAGRTFWVDVKCPRSLRSGKRADDPFAQPQDRYVCLEVHASGWLFEGLADYIAFQRLDGRFVMTDRRALAAWTLETLSALPQERAEWPEQSVMCPYIRTGNGHTVALMYVPVLSFKECIVGLL